MRFHFGKENGFHMYTRPVLPPNAPIMGMQDLAAFMAQAATPKEFHKIHTAVEVFPYRLNTLENIGYDDPQGMLGFLISMEGFGWQPILENNLLVGVKRNLSTLTLRMGGQLEISCTSASTLHESTAELDLVVDEINQIGIEQDIGFLGMGFHPTAHISDIPVPPGKRFRVAQDFWGQRADRMLDAMQRGCAGRISLAYENEADMVKKLRVATALHPVVTALFASSPFLDGRITEYKSVRMHAITRSESGDNALIPRLFDPSFGYESFVAWAADQPLLYIQRDGALHAGGGDSFKSFMDGHHTALRQFKPICDDWEQHLKSLVSDASVNLTHGLTIQSADAGPTEMMIALSAFWTGLLYDSSALEKAWGFVRSWSPDALAQLRMDAPRHGLLAEINGVPLQEIAEHILKMALQGLRRRSIRLYGGPDEARYLQILLDYAESGQSRADAFFVQQQYYTDFSMRTVFDTCRMVSMPRDKVVAFA